MPFDYEQWEREEREDQARTKAWFDYIWKHEAQVRQAPQTELLRCILHDTVLATHTEIERLMDKLRVKAQVHCEGCGRGATFVGCTEFAVDAPDREAAIHEAELLGQSRTLREAVYLHNLCALDGWQAYDAFNVPVHRAESFPIE